MRSISPPPRRSSVTKAIPARRAAPLEASLAGRPATSPGDVFRGLPAGAPATQAKPRAFEMQQSAPRLPGALGIEFAERTPDQQLHDLGLRRLGRGFARDQAVAHDGDAIGDAGHLFQAVRYVDDADAGRAEIAHDPEQPFDLAGGQRGGRLVHDQDPRGA
jgi:hypothetical protein